MTVLCNENWASSLHKIMDSHCEPRQNLTNSSHLATLLLRTHAGFATCSGTVPTNLEGWEIPIYSVSWCFGPVLLRYLLVECYISVTFVKPQQRYGSPIDVVNNCEGDHQTSFYFESRTEETSPARTGSFGTRFWTYLQCLLCIRRGFVVEVNNLHQWCFIHQCQHHNEKFK